MRQQSNPTGAAALRDARKSLGLLIFDLDGTLIDSRADLVSSINAMLRELARPELPGPVVSHYVGDGAAVLVQRALGLLPPPSRGHTGEVLAAPLAAPQQALAEAGLRFFLDYYGRHNLDRTRLYPGVAAGLRQLAAHGCQLAILTNKPVHASRQIVDGLGLDGLFCAVYGGNSFPHKKPDPVGIHALLAQLDLPPQRALMVGDTGIDVRAGRNAGVWTCGVRYGFAPASLHEPAPDLLVDSFSELTSALLAQ